MDLLQETLGGAVLAALALAALLAGFVRGLTGYGAALVFIPFAGTIVGPVNAIATLWWIDISGTVQLLPSTLRSVRFSEVRFLAAGALLGVPAGVFLLTTTDPVLIRWAASSMAIIALAVIASGCRHEVTHENAPGMAIGASSGFLAGSVGMAGVPLVAFYLGGGRSPANIRATATMFFLFLNVVMGAMLWFRGGFGMHQLPYVAVAFVPYLIGARLGILAFRRAQSRTLLWAAYITILASAVLGLPPVIAWFN